MLNQLNSVLLIVSNPSLQDMLVHIAKRLGTKHVSWCHKNSLAFFELASCPKLIIEDVSVKDREDFFIPYLEQQHPQKIPVLVPVFALMQSESKSDFEFVESAGYIDYSVLPINESLLEQTLRDLLTTSYSYDAGYVLYEVVEQHIKNNNLKLAYTTLMPALALKPNNTNYLIQYTKILFAQNKFSFSQTIVNNVLELEPNNVTAKNILTKILLATKQEVSTEDVEKIC